MIRFNTKKEDNSRWAITRSLKSFSTQAPISKLTDGPIEKVSCNQLRSAADNKTIDVDNVIMFAEAYDGIT